MFVTLVFVILSAIELHHSCSYGSFAFILTSCFYFAFSTVLITYLGEFTIYEVNRIGQAAQFTAALDDPTSPEFLDLSLKVCGVVSYGNLIDNSTLFLEVFA